MITIVIIAIVLITMIVIVITVMATIARIVIMVRVIVIIAMIVIMATIARIVTIVIVIIAILVIRMIMVIISDNEIYCNNGKNSNRFPNHLPNCSRKTPSRKMGALLKTRLRTPSSEHRNENKALTAPSNTGHARSSCSLGDARHGRFPKIRVHRSQYIIILLMGGP